MGAATCLVRRRPDRAPPGYAAFLVLLVRRLHPGTGAPQGPFVLLPPTPLPASPLSGGGGVLSRAFPARGREKRRRAAPRALFPLSRREPSTLLPLTGGRPGGGWIAGPATPRNSRSSTGMRNAGYALDAGKAFSGAWGCARRRSMRVLYASSSSPSHVSFRRYRRIHVGLPPDRRTFRMISSG